MGIGTDADGREAAYKVDVVPSGERFMRVSTKEGRREGRKEGRDAKQRISKENRSIPNGSGAEWRAAEGRYRSPFGLMARKEIYAAARRRGGA